MTTVLQLTNAFLKRKRKFCLSNGKSVSSKSIRINCWFLEITRSLLMDLIRVSLKAKVQRNIQIKLNAWLKPSSPTTPRNVEVPTEH